MRIANTQKGDAENRIAAKRKRMEARRKRDKSFLLADGYGRYLPVFIFTAVCILVSCVTTKQRLIKYETNDYQVIVDSIKNSGSVVDGWRTYNYVLDNDSVDKVTYAIILRNGNATGSIQIRKNKYGVYDIKIIDTYKGK